MREGLFGNHIIEDRYYRLIIVTFCKLAESRKYDHNNGDHRVKMAKIALNRAIQGEGTRPGGEIWSMVTDVVTDQSVSDVTRHMNNLTLLYVRGHMADCKRVEGVVKEEMARCAAAYTPRPQQAPKPIKQIVQELSASDDLNQTKELIEQLALKFMLTAQASLGVVEAELRDVRQKNEQLLDMLVNGRRSSDDGDEDDGNEGDGDEGDGDEDDGDEDGGDEDDGDEDYDVKMRIAAGRATRVTGSKV